MVDPAPPLFRVYAQADVRRVLRKRMKEGQLNLHAHKRTHDACYAHLTEGQHYRSSGRRNGGLTDQAPCVRMVVTSGISPAALRQR